jgi:hypothetical protein
MQSQRHPALRLPFTATATAATADEIALAVGNGLTSYSSTAHLRCMSEEWEARIKAVADRARAAMAAGATLDEVLRTFRTDDQLGSIASMRALMELSGMGLSCAKLIVSNSCEGRSYGQLTLNDLVLSDNWISPPPCCLSSRYYPSASPGCYPRPLWGRPSIGPLFSMRMQSAGALVRPPSRVPERGAPRSSGAHDVHYSTRVSVRKPDIMFE